MSKNMTRKGLAFGAGLALLGSGLIAMPAQAAGSVTLSPSAGTSYNTVTSSTFKLMPVISGLNADEYKYLRYKVTNSDQAEFQFDIEQGSTADGEFTVQYGTASSVATGVTTALGDFFYDTTANVLEVVIADAERAKYEVGDRVTISGFTYATGDAGLTAAINATHIVTVIDNTDDHISMAITDDISSDVGTSITSSPGEATAGTIQNRSNSNDDSFVVVPDDVASGTNVAAIGGQNYLKVKPTALSTASVLTVQAWIDGNQNNTIDAGEITSAVETVTFKPVSTLSATVAIDAVYAGATSITAAVTLTGDINYQQIDSGNVTLTNADTAATITGESADINFGWNAVTGRYEATDTGLAGVASTDVIDVFVEVDNDYDGLVDESKATATKTIATTVADVTFEAKVVNSATAVNTQSSRSDTGSGGDVVDFATRAGTGSVLEGSAGFSVSMFVGTDAVTALGISSVPVQVSVTSTNVTATDLVTVGGKKLVSGTTTTLNITTDATGNASVPVVLGASDDNDTITFAFAPYGTSLGSSNLVVTVTDGTGDGVLTQVTPGSPSIELGDTFSIAYQVVDLFGKAPANNTHSILVAPTANERTKAPVWSFSLPVVDGKATLTVTDNGTGLGKFTANAKLVANGTTTALTNGTVDVVVNVVADKDAATLTTQKLTYGTAQAADANNDGDFADTGDTDNTGALLVESRAFANYDSRNALPTVAAPTVRDTYKVVVGAKATNAAGTAVVGAPVTFSAAGMLFKSGTVYSKDSITVHAGATGIASVDVWSSVGGAREISITSGTATATQKLTFAAGTGAAGSFTVTAPASSAAGKTVDVAIKVLDALGNAAKGVTVTLYSTGPGYLINTTGTTLADGSFSTKLLLGTNDSGTAKVSAIVTIAGVETIKTAEIKVGATADQKVNAGSFKGYVALYAKGYAGQRMSAKVGKDWVVVESLASNFERVVEFTGAGYTISVPIYIDRVLVDTITVTTK